MAYTVTTSTDGDARDGDGESLHPELVIAFECERPSARPERHALDDVDLVVIGRMDERTAVRDVHKGMRRLRVGVPDRRMSQEHARLVRARNHWVLEDAGSKNGTLHNGVRAPRATLDDGDLVETGRTLLMYREVPAHTSVANLPPGLATFDPSLASAFTGLARVARSQVPVMLFGETGTGKEVTARALHELSGRSGPLVAVNCGALPATLLEATLFGHRRGAFSGAVESRPGLIRSADRGTLFLDEIGELPATAQAALLRALQEQEVLPVGEETPVQVDLRVCTATNRDLSALVAAGQFRRDLYARLAGLTVRLPPLRERRADLGLLIGVLLERLRAPTSVKFTPSAARAMFMHDWPLNIRGLEKHLATAMALAGDEPIDVHHFPEPLTPATRAVPVEELSAEERLHRDELISALEAHGGNVAAVARVFGKGRQQIHRWAERYGISLAAFRR